MHKRLQKLQIFLKAKNLDALLITYPSNLFYFSGFRSLTYNEREAYVFVSKSHAYIITSKLYFDEAKNIKNFLTKELSAEFPLVKVLAEICKSEYIRSVGFEEHNLTYHEYRKLSEAIPKLTPTMIDQLRIQKDEEEIAYTAKACEIGDKAFDFILSKIKTGITEEEIAFEMEIFMRKQGALPSFPSIVAFGKNAAVPHHSTGQEKLNNNEFVLLDFGVRVFNYCSDMTRTVFVGKPNTEQKRMYETVRIAQEKALELIKDSLSKGNTLAKTVDKVARDYIISQGYPNFPHSLGHGIGIDVHEGIRLSPMSETILKEGMIFSVEPGIYLANQAGVRIEDIVSIEKNELKLLTKSPKELIVL